MNQRTKRARRVQSRLDSLPLREEAVREAFQDFRMFGELPEQERLAQAVIESAIAGEVRLVEEENALMRAFRELREERDAAGGKPKERTLRDYLLNHAGFAPPALRLPAQLACTVLAARGVDLTDPNALADEPLPGHNGIGMHLLGYPGKLATAPYEEQGRRLFARYESMRERAPQEPEWFEAFSDAADEFRDNGVLPDDELLRDAVVADVELEALVRHRRGHDVAALMAALHLAAKTTGDEHDAAIEGVMRLVMVRPSM